ncbi:conserved hypothetical protein [Syntrophobacter fumaroxidans MPOB]|uniref:OstA family protein n=1 Tax=Syntrophobacter fumaroxidans (strain DSM 10017 / MPOB) TaxID=335543 RepID=A0LPE1_SYNFM|nr:conserved hypothetical protein [Syntrophobacter fumaroxidans MPOB]
MRVFTKYVFIAAVVLLMTAPALADVRLTGTVGPRIIDDNAYVPRDATATLNGTTIKGNLRVLRGAKVFANGAHITGNVEGYRSRLVDLRQRTSVGGNVQGKYTRSVLVRGGTFVGGNVQIDEGFAPIDVDVLLVNLSTVDGDVQPKESAGRARVLASRVGGNVQFVENYSGPYAVRNNRIDGDLQFFKNRGRGVITGNHVKGNLQSKENSPRPIIRDNIVEGDVEIE